MPKKKSADALYKQRVKNLKHARAVKAAKQAGGLSFKEFLGKANDFAKKLKPASIASGIIDNLGVRDKIAMSPIGNIALKGLDFAKEKGYGRRKRR